MRELAVVEVDVAQDGVFEVLAASEAVALQDILDPAVGAFDRAVRLRPHRGCEVVLDAEVGAEQVELVLSCGAALAQAEQSVGEGLAIVGQNPGDLHRGGTFEIAQEPPRVGRSLRRIDADEDPPCGAVDGHEELAPPLLVRHLRQVFHVDMQVAGLVGLEGAVRRLRLFRLQRPQVAQAMAPQAAVEAGPRDLRVEELAHHGQQVVERQQKRLAQRHRNGLLRRRQRRLQPVRRVAPVVNVLAVAPLPHRLLARPKPFR